MSPQAFVNGQFEVPAASALTPRTVCVATTAPVTLVAVSVQVPTAARVTEKDATPLALAVSVSVRTPAFWHVIVKVTTVFASAPEMVAVNGAPTVGVESDTVKLKPGAS